MVARINSAEGGTDGVAVTVANSGGDSGDAWDSLYVPWGTSLTFATGAAQKGTLGYRMVQGTRPTVGANVRWNLTGWAQVRARWYVKFDAYPSVWSAMCYITDASNTDAIVWVNITTSGHLELEDDLNTPLFVSADPIPLDTWIRVELAVVPGTTTTNGTIRFAYAAGDGAATETYENLSANLDVHGDLGRLYLGKLHGTWDASLDFDDAAADDTSTAFMGASAAGPTVPDPSPAPILDVPTWPPPPPFPQAIRSSATLAYSVTATYAGAPVDGATGMAPIGGSIVDTSKPGVRRLLNLQLAGGQTLFESLAPTGTLLTVTCTVTYTDRSTLTIPMGVFDIDSDNLTEGAGTISVKAPDKWVRIQRAQFLTPTASTPGMAVTEQIAVLIRGALGADEPVTITATSSASVGTLVWEKDREKAIIDLAASIGAWVFFDRQGEAIVADLPTAGTPYATWLVDSSASGVLTELDRERSRVDAYNVVVVESSAADGSKFTTQIVWDDNPNSPTYAGTDPLTAPETAGEFGIVTRYLDDPNLSTANQALAAGAALLARGVGVSSQVSLSQVPNPAVDAFDIVDVLPPKESFNSSRVVERHIVDTVTHSLTVGPDQQIEARSTGPSA